MMETSTTDVQPPQKKSRIDEEKEDKENLLPLPPGESQDMKEANLPQGWEMTLDRDRKTIYLHRDSGVATSSKPFQFATPLNNNMKTSNAENVPPVEHRIGVKKTKKRDPFSSVGNSNMSVSVAPMKQDVELYANMGVLPINSRQDQQCQTILKGWLHVGMDVSVQQPNGLFKVQSFDVEKLNLSDESLCRPLRMWFPPEGVDASLQTDIKGWLDADLDVITEDTDGNFYLKKEKEFGPKPSDQIYRPYRIHRATQVRWLGSRIFHKATQTQWSGNAVFHKATQFPDPDSKHNGEGHSVMYAMDKGCPVTLPAPMFPMPACSIPNVIMETLPLNVGAPMPSMNMMLAPSTTNATAQPLTDGAEATKESKEEGDKAEAPTETGATKEQSETSSTTTSTSTNDSVDFLNPNNVNIKPLTAVATVKPCEQPTDPITSSTPTSSEGGETDDASTSGESGDRIITPSASLAQPMMLPQGMIPLASAAPYGAPGMVPMMPGMYQPLFPQQMFPQQFNYGYRYPWM